MIHLVTEISKYIMIILFAIYTYYSYSVLAISNEDRQKRIYKSQTTCMFLIHLDAYLVLFASQKDWKLLAFYVGQVLFVLFLFLIYRVIYKKAATLVVNHMCMLMIIGFIILARLDLNSAIRQFEIAVAATVISIFIPQLVRKLKLLRKFTWAYGIVGILALGAVFALGRVTGGAKLSFSVAGITVQPSEFVKIIFVFFIACMLYQATDFRQVCITTIAAAIHVLILVVSTDLGAALIYFITYIVMLYVATRKPIYFAGGFGLGAVAALVASKLFSHVRVRIAAWKDPFADIYGGGQQVAFSLFAIGTGGWFGMGLYQGMPYTIPVAVSDFVFAAISEEMGGIFAICIILVCFSCFIMCLNIALQIRDQFYKLIALGLGCVYGVQVFLNIGGVIKFIPSTGVTLPLISYGGSSILCTIVIFAIIQGLYIMRQDEGDLDEQKNNGQKKKRTTQKKQSAGQHRGDELRRTGQKDKYPENTRRKKRPTGFPAEKEIEEIW